MRAPFFRGWLLAVTCAGLVCAASLNAEPAASNPWAKVAALPTACYNKEDPADAKLQAAYDSVSADHVAQNQINDKIREDYQNIDPMELARRMQENMMKDPQNAAKYLQQTQSMGQEMQTEVPETLARDSEFKSESKDLLSRFDVALRQASAPADARWTALKKKLGIPPDSPGPGESGVPDWAWVEWGAILRAWDQAYVDICPQWWGTGGEVHAFMKGYKDWLVQERIPIDQKGDQATIANYEMMNTPAASYRSVAAMKAVEDYIKLAQELFSHRTWEPRCTADGC
jgi:hypothetical protein